MLPLSFLHFSVHWWQSLLTVSRVLPLLLWLSPGLKPISRQRAIWTGQSSLMALSNSCHKARPFPSPGPAQPPSQLHWNTLIGPSGGGWKPLLLTDSRLDSHILCHKQGSLFWSMSYRHMKLGLFSMHNLIQRAWYSAFTNKQERT